MGKPVVLCILDGWGHRTTRKGNAPALAHTPTFDALAKTGPMAHLITHGPDVGLPSGQMGNSEVGHTNIGAGRVVAMDLGQVDLAIEDGSFAANPKIEHFCDKLRQSGGTAHIMGLMSDGGVHGHLTHFFAAIKVLRAAGLKVILHLITDGRDVAPQTALKYLQDLQPHLRSDVQIGTVTGRYFALDRDNRWDRVKTAYDAIVQAQASSAPSPKAAIERQYKRGVTDEFIPATVIKGYAGIKAADGLFCLNFRADRAREILAALADPDFNEFERPNQPPLSAMLGMVSYSDQHDSFMPCVFAKRDIKNTLGEWVAAHGKTQFRLAETEKYPHVTFFMNGGREQPYQNEDRYMPQSPKVATYDLQPEMSAPEVTDHFVQAIERGYDLIIVNYANPDMVGHTGDLSAAIAACEAVDNGLSAVLRALEKSGGVMLLTADHGNCELMHDPQTGGPHTAHTTNLVPVILVNGPKSATLKDGRLADVAPTLLHLMGLTPPPQMSGKNLIHLSDKGEGRI